MTKTASQKARRAAVRQAASEEVTHGSSPNGNSVSATLENGLVELRLRRDREALRRPVVVVEPPRPVPVADPDLDDGDGRRPRRRTAKARGNPVPQGSVVAVGKASAELRGLDSFAAKAAEAKRVIASQYLSQLVDVDSPPYDVGYPDGLGLETAVTTAIAEPPVVAAVRSSDDSTWAGIAIIPAIEDTYGSDAYPSAWQLTAVAADGTITWTPLTWTNQVLDSVVAAMSAWRPVTHSIKMLDESAQDIKGGYAFVGTYQIASTGNASAATMGVPSNVADIVDNPEYYQRVNLTGNALHDVTVGWMPNAVQSASTSTGGGLRFVGTGSAGSSWIGEMGLVYLARLPTTSAAPGEYSVRTWQLRRVVEWLPAEATGALASSEAGLSTNALAELSDVKQYVEAKTGVILSNSRGIRSQSFISDAWRSATRIVSDIAKTATAVAQVGNAAAGGVRTVIGAVSQIGRIVGALGSASRPRMMALSLTHSPAMLRQHFDAVHRGKISIIVAQAWARRLGDPRFEQDIVRLMIDYLRSVEADDGSQTGGAAPPPSRAGASPVPVSGPGGPGSPSEAQAGWTAVGMPWPKTSRA